MKKDQKCMRAGLIGSSLVSDDLLEYSGIDVIHGPTRRPFRVVCAREFCAMSNATSASTRPPIRTRREDP
jgi:hypothetical protein